MRAALLRSALLAWLACTAGETRAAGVDLSDDVVRWVLAQKSGAALLTFQVRRVEPVRCRGCVQYDLAEIRALVGTAWPPGPRLWMREPDLEAGRTYVVAWGDGCRPHVLAHHVLTDRTAFESEMKVRIANLRAERPVRPVPERVCGTANPPRRAPVLDSTDRGAP